jgi:paraquat-inducible protein B
MSEPESSAKPGPVLPKAIVKKRRAAWLLWLVPLAAAALCVWFVYRDFVAVGPAITIYFQNAEGLEEGNTQVNFRGAEVGRVKKLDLTPDHRYVKVKVRLVGSAKNLARAGSSFWIVRPEVKLGAISGLRTIISGEYIAVQPGGGSRTNTFFGAEKPPIAEEPRALNIALLAPGLGSLREQSSIFYRGVQVGEVLEYQLGPDGREVVIRARIRPEYAPLVRLNSKFWNAGGINFKFSLFHGASISAESAETLISGGIEFATPPELEPPANNGTTFFLYDKPEETWKKWSPGIKLNLPQQAPERAAPAGAPSK